MSARQATVGSPSSNVERSLAGGFRLGEWTVRPADGSIASATGTIRLEPLLMELLVFLCSRRGQVVSKDEVLERVWRGRIVSEDTLKAAFYQLRKALGDEARRPRYIETLPKRGYRVLVEPTPLEDGRRESLSAAETLFRSGRALLEGRLEPTALNQARVYLERALEADPGHAGALAALARVDVQLAAAGGDGGLVERAKALATRAVDAAPESPAAHAVLAIATLLGDRDAAAAERGFRRALALDPADGTARRWLAKLLSFTGRHDEAIAEARRALEADPLSIEGRRDLVEALFLARRSDDAADEAQRLLQRFPEETDVQLGLTWIHWAAGDGPRAFEAFYAGLRGSSVADEVLAGAARAFGEGGMPEVFRQWARVLERQAALGRKALDLAVLYALLGEGDRAFERLDAIIRQSHPALLWIPVAPVFDRLRADARYRTLLAQLRLAGPEV